MRNKTLNEKIGLKIKTLRESYHKKLTQEALGKIIGVHQQHISKYEQGTAYIPAEVLWKISNFFVVAMEDFFEEKPTIKIDTQSLIDSLDIKRELQGTDICMARVLEEVIHILITKKILKPSELSIFAQELINNRESLRTRLNQKEKHHKINP